MNFNHLLIIKTFQIIDREGLFMSLLVNPKERIVNVAVDGYKISLVLRQYTMNEYANFMEQRFSFKHTGEVNDKSMTARVHFVDQLLLDIRAEDEDGRKEEILFNDPQTNEQKQLTPQVPNWKEFIDASWKIATAIKLEQQAAQLESNVLKN